MSWLQRVKQRKLIQWALAYLAGAWAVLQGVGFLTATYAWPPMLMRVLPVVLAIGFLATLVLAWFHGERGNQKISVVEIALLGLLVFGGAGGVGVMARHQPAARVAATDKAEVDNASIAVLPFKNASSDREQDYFSDGLTEELLNVLARIEGLRVAARTSSFAFKGKDVSADSIGHALRVAHLLEGNVEKSGDRVRIRVHLVDTRSGYERWSDSYERKLTDVFALQDEISRTVANQLRVQFTQDVPLVAQETTDTTAHALLLQGLRETRFDSPTGRARSLEFYRRAVKQDPKYARAHAALANSILWQGYWRSMPRDAAYREAKAEASLALQLDPRQTDGHRALAALADLYDWDFDAAERHLDEAQALSPSDAGIYNRRAWLLLHIGKTREAIAAAERATQLDPLESSAYNSLGLSFVFDRQYDRAVQTFRLASQISPGAAHIYGNLAMAYSWWGRFPESLQATERMMALDSNSVLSLTTAARAYWRAGRHGDAQKTLDKLLARPEAPPYRIASVYATFGDKKRALQYLDRAVSVHDDNASWIAVAQEFEPYHNDPGFQDILTRAGLAGTHTNTKAST